MGTDSSDAGLPATDLWKLDEYLRDKAHHCIRLARTCSDPATAHELEAMGIEFLEKAAKIHQVLTIPPAEFT